MNLMNYLHLKLRSWHNLFILRKQIVFKKLKSKTSLVRKDYMQSIKHLSAIQNVAIFLIKFKMPSVDIKNLKYWVKKVPLRIIYHNKAPTKKNQNLKDNHRLEKKLWHLGPLLFNFLPSATKLLDPSPLSSSSFISLRPIDATTLN